MSAKLKAKWVKALRSGKYEKATGDLKFREDGHYSFCCLGVLRHITYPTSTLSNPGEEYLHERHLKEFGLTNDQQHRLGGKNDNGWSFPRIADWIEKNL